MAKKFHITTFGCQMNEHDSEVLSGLLLEKGYEKVADRKHADIAIINTCSIRENADMRFFGTLGSIQKRKEIEKDDFTVVVCGCMMQQQHIIDKIKERYPWVDVVFGTHNLNELPQLLDNLFLEKKKQRSIYQEGGAIIEGLPCDRPVKHRAYVNIMFGCNNFCSYCIVPYTRGRERSRRVIDVVNEVKNLVADGVKEIMLLGQNVNSYRGLNEDGSTCDFADLIYILNDIEGLERIRFMTSHPKDLSDKLINAFGDCKKLCRFFHLPIQSGSNRVLKEMNRRYTKEQYLELVRKLRAVAPDMALCTDIIVGFPGETDDDFNDTLEICKEVGYDQAFTFMYSMRSGTPAAEREDQVPEDIKYQRFNTLVDLINESWGVKNTAYIGKTVEVLVDGPSKKNSKTFTGRTGTFKLVNFRSENKDIVGKLVKVKIVSGTTFSLDGEIVE